MLVLLLFGLCLIASRGYACAEFPQPPLPTATVDSSVALLWPVYGEYKNPFLFKWIGPPDDTYQVTLRHRDQGHVINSGPISAIDWIIDIPAEQFGNWEWYVTNSTSLL